PHLQLPRRGFARTIPTSDTPIFCEIAPSHGERENMAEPLIDLKALLVERDECNAGTVTKLREGLAQGGPQFKNLRDVADLLKKKIESAPPAAQKNLHLKLGVVSYFLGQTHTAIDHLRHAEGALANFYLGRALASRGEY